MCYHHPVLRIPTSTNLITEYALIVKHFVHLFLPHIYFAVGCEQNMYKNCALCERANNLKGFKLCNESVYDTFAKMYNMLTVTLRSTLRYSRAEIYTSSRAL